MQTAPVVVSRGSRLSVHSLGPNAHTETRETLSTTTENTPGFFFQNCQPRGESRYRVSSTVHKYSPARDAALLQVDSPFYRFFSLVPLSHSYLSRFISPEGNPSRETRTYIHGYTFLSSSSRIQLVIKRTPFLHRMYCN